MSDEFVGPPAPDLFDLRTQLNLTGPMITKHFAEGDYNDWHPGIGAELQATPYNGDSPWNVAAGGHWMQNDSFNEPMWWAGVTPSYTFGDRDGWWLEPGVMAGALSKQSFNGGEVSPFLLPRVGVGCGNLGLDLGYVPQIPNVNDIPVGMLMLRGAYEF